MNARLMENCPNCGKEIMAGALKCKYCGADPRKVLLLPDEPPATMVHEPVSVEVTPATKTCPYCAEEVKFEAVRCKHCGSDLSATVPEEVIMVVRESRAFPGFWAKILISLSLYYWLWSNHQLIVTNKRVTVRQGVLAKAERFVPLDRIQNVTVRRGVLGAMFNYGDIAIDSAGGPGAELVFPAAANAEQVKEAIIQQIGW